jgi:anaerobic magnesium-protoporphyrin IX monomethyl ester cyclase
MKVMLLSLPGIGEDDKNSFPLGIGYLVGVLKPFHEVEAHHYQKMCDAREEIRGNLCSFMPDIVGLTCSTFNRGFVREMIGIIRGVGLGIKIVVGGVHASFCYDQILNQYGADVVVIGEGEYTLRELCNALEKNIPLESVKGIAYKENGKVIRTSLREALGNLDDLPMPDYSYAKHFIERSKMAFIITSRGCPVRCMFCSTSSYWGQKVRMNSVPRVVDEMEMVISRFKVKKIFFYDDTFNLGISRVKAICKEIIDRGIKVDWACSCRVTPVSEDMIAAMVEAGCRHICWGVEAGSEEILKKINKKITLSQIRNAFELSKKYSDIMATNAFIMVGNPGETAKTVQDTVNFLNTLPLTDYLSASVLYVLPGTLLYEDIKRRGYMRDEDWFRYDTVPSYTLENSLRTLAKWQRMINCSGNRTFFDPYKHFWFGVTKVMPEIKTDKKAAQRIVKLSRLFFQPKRVVSIIKRYLPAGRIRF